MPSMFKKAMLYLGLGSDEDFEALDRENAEDVDRVRALDSAGSEVPVDTAGPSLAGPVDPEAEPARATVSAVRPIPIDEVPERVRRPSSVVRPIPAPATAKPQVVSPASFNEAQEVADTFKRNQPVIVNLQQADRDLTRRLIDFASGLCYGVGGDMQKVADHVYLLTPADVEVSAEERQILQEAGLHD